MENTNLIWFSLAVLIGVSGFMILSGGGIQVSESAIPPTPAITMINVTGGGNVTAQDHNGFVEFEGVAMTISPDYDNNKITFTASEGATINNPSIACGSDNHIVDLSVDNSTGVWSFTCDVDNIGSSGATVNNPNIACGSDNHIVDLSLNNSTGVWSYSCDADNNDPSGYSMGFTEQGVIVKASTLYFGLSSGTDSTENNVEYYMPHAKTISKLYCYVSASGTDANSVITVRKNNVDTTLTVTFGTGATGLQSDLVNSFTVVAGDTINIAVANASSGGGARSLTLESCSFEVT